MDVQTLECNKVEFLKTPNEIRTFSKDFASKLAESIAAEGLYNPIAVRPNLAKPGWYIGVQGKHRFYATKTVLKEQFIACNVIADMDEAEAEMAMIAENLWRNPLSKTQHVLCVKKWFEHYANRNPDRVGKGKSGGMATAKARAEKATEAVTAETGGETTGDTVSAEVETSKEDAASSFASTVAAATGQSEASAKRTQKLATSFTEEQLEAFSQMSVTQADMLLVAKIKDEVKRGEVVNLIASGMDPKEAIREVTGSKAEKDAAVTEKAEAKEETSADLSDDEWFEKYCGEKAAMLGAPAKFKSDALLYRAITDTRHSFRAKSKKSVKDRKKSGVTGAFWNLVNRFMSVSHPKDWLLCPECLGKGAVSSDGNPKVCPKCYGGGYQLKTEEYL